MFTPSIFFQYLCHYLLCNGFARHIPSLAQIHFESCQVRIIDTSAEHLGTCFFFLQTNSKTPPLKA